MTLQEQQERGDFTHLASRDSYAQYFSLLNNVLNILLRWVSVRGAEDHVVHDLRPMVDKLLYTVGLLRLKYLFNPDHELALDLNESGYPHSVGFSRVESALKSRDTVLAGLPTVPVLRDILIGELLTTQSDSLETLRALGESAFYAGLDQDKLFLPFTPGRLELLESQNPKVRSYVYTWATFGSGSNTPYFHSLAFEQDVSRDVLTRESAEWQELEKSIRFASEHHPHVGILIYQIDDASNAIHPKFLQRVQLGPIFAPLIDIGGPGTEFCQILREQGNANDAVLELCFETVISQGSKVTTGLFSPGGRVREIFFLPNGNPEAFERRASRVVRKIILPHRVLQSARKQPFFDAYRGYGKITYTPTGEIIL